MDQELTIKWLEALNSGRYNQVKEVLHNLTTNSYCCLGVLCTLLDVHTTDYVVENLSNPMVSVKTYDCMIYGLSKNICDKTGLTRFGKLRRPVEYKGKFVETLTDLNDAGMTFEEIAKVIKDQF